MPRMVSPTCTTAAGRETSKPQLTGRNCFTLRPLPRGPCISIPLGVGNISHRASKKSHVETKNLTLFASNRRLKSRVQSRRYLALPEVLGQVKMPELVCLAARVADSADRSLKTENLR